MIILDTTSKSLEMVLDGAVSANQLSFLATYVDLSTLYVPGANDGLSNDTTPVTLVAAPGATTSRQVKLLVIFNNDIVNAIVTIQYKNGANTRKIIQVTLAPGYSLQYNDSSGWAIFPESTSGTAITNLPMEDRCSVYNNAVQNIPTSTWTAVQFNSEDFDTAGFHDPVTNNTRFTIPSGKDGLYIAVTSVIFNSGGAAGNAGLYFWKNGALPNRSYWNYINMQVTAGANSVASQTFLDELVAGDYIELYAFQQKSVTSTMDIGNATRSFAAQLSLARLSN